MSFSTHASNFRKNKDALSPTFKPEANIPAHILRVRDIKSSIEESQQDGKKFAQFTLLVDIQTSEGVQTKEWKIGSAKLVDTLEDKGIDVGSSFDILKRGEGVNSKYEVTNVKNAPKEPVAQTVEPSETVSTESTLEPETM